MILSLLVFLACGAIAGLFAGLLGIGGGVIIIPILTLVFPFLGIPAPLIHHLALGTSLANIMITSFASARMHNKHGAVRWEIVKGITPGIIVGTFLGGLIASHLSSFFLKALFAVFLYCVAAEMLIAKAPQGNRRIPGIWGLNMVGSIIGMLSGFVGIGGGVMSVPFMTFCSIPMRTAVATSAAIGFPIAISGTLGYIVGGFDVVGLPSGTLGYVHLWALLGMGLAGFLTAPLGAKLTHTLPIPLLKRFFAIFLLIMATRIVWNLF